MPPMLLESLGYKHCCYGMEEVIGSIPIRSTNKPNSLLVLQNCLRWPTGSNKNSSLQSHFSTVPIHTSRSFSNPCFMRVTLYEVIRTCERNHSVCRGSHR